LSRLRHVARRCRDLQTDRDAAHRRSPDPPRIVCHRRGERRDHQRRPQPGRGIVAVGTTVTRVLETVGRDGLVGPRAGTTELFITPGYEFKVVDAMVTNFHLPRSTLLALVTAFAGLENVRCAYRHAVAQRYRFYSYGDAMLIV